MKKQHRELLNKQKPNGFTPEELERLNREFKEDLLTQEEEEDIIEQIKKDMAQHKAPGHISLAGSVSRRNDKDGIIWK